MTPQTPTGSAQVSLTVTRGNFRGKQFVFSDRTVCKVGRAADCDLRLPGCPEVSRRHCVLDIDPPSIRVHDCGSRNGTFVNEVLIGCQRGEDSSAVFELKAGDELRLGDVTFCVGCATSDPNEAGELEAMSA